MVHALSDSSSFDVEMGHMDKRVFYDNLMGMFKADPKWAEELLDWYAM
jgi:hypothetical protein